MQSEPYDIDPYSDVTYIQTEWDDTPALRDVREESAAAEAAMPPPAAATVVEATPAR